MAPAMHWYPVLASVSKFGGSVGVPECASSQCSSAARSTSARLSGWQKTAPHPAPHSATTPKMSLVVSTRSDSMSRTAISAGGTSGWTAWCSGRSSGRDNTMGQTGAWKTGRN